MSDVIERSLMKMLKNLSKDENIYVPVVNEGSENIDNWKSRWATNFGTNGHFGTCLKLLKDYRIIYNEIIIFSLCSESA